MRKAISLTIEEKHVASLDAMKDEYNTRSDVANKIFDEYFGLLPKQRMR
jgi:hypothetical protein